MSDGAIHRLTHQVGPKYGAVWSPDGSKIAYTHTTRPITSMETTAEDNHLYIMNADGSGAHLVTGQADLRYGTPQWSADGTQLYFTLQDHGQVKLEREPAAGGPPDVVVGGEGSLGYSGWSLAKTGAVAYAYTTPASPAQLYVASGTRLAAATHASRPGRARRQADRASRAAGVQDPRRTLGGGVPDPSGRTSAPRPRPTPCPWW